MNKGKTKFIIIGIIVGCLIIMAIANSIKNKNKENEPKFECVEIERQSLKNTLSFSGNIKTENRKNVTSVLAGNKITEVNVSVGDKVEVGDVLLSFDTSMLKKTASDLSASISATKQQSNININTADRAVQDAVNNKNVNLDNLKSTMEQAQGVYDQATQTRNSQVPNLQTNISNLQSEIDSYAILEQNLNNALNTVSSAQTAYKEAESNKNAIQSQYDILVASIDPNLVGSNMEVAQLNAQLLEANTALTTAQSSLNAAQNELTSTTNAFKSIENRYATVKAEIGTINSQISTLDQTAQQAKTNYEQAVKAYNNAISSLDSAILNAEDVATNARIGAKTSTLSLEEQLMNANKQLEEGNLKSPVSGTVTAVSVKKGDTYQGGTLLTIDGTDSFIVEANVDEYDIADIKVGMDAIIKTDATRDDELEGKVIFVSPASNESITINSTSSSYSSTANSGEATYLVKIEVLTQNDRLRLGMNAKINLITEKAEDVLTVPYNAITEKENGKKIITVVNDDESQSEIEVEIGLETGYYSEIKSDKIKEGMKVVIPNSEGNSTLSELLESMGATGGIE